MVTATYTAGSQTLYFDGCLVGTDAYPGPLPLVAEAVQIGGFDGFGPYHHPWIGDIDEVSIYTRVLGAAEALELYELHRPGRTCPGPPITGCIELSGTPVVGSKVMLKQAGEHKQTTTTDAAGCYAFDSAGSGKKFQVIIKSPVEP
jgi:concanavalin A-like lectin/glucanase superfamily protein